MAKIELKLKKRTISVREKKRNMNELKDTDKNGQFQKAVEMKIKEEKDNGLGANRKWNQLKNAIKEGAEEVYGFQKARVAKSHGLQMRCWVKWTKEGNGKVVYQRVGKGNTHD